MKQNLAKTKINWQSLPLNKIFSLLNSSNRGLSGQQARARQKTFGLNKLPTAREISVWRIFFNQIQSPLVYILFLAGLISLFLNHLTDAGVIFFIVLINTFFGFFQEYKANQALAKLKKIVTHWARVWRDGQEIKIKTQDLAPGDIIFLQPGDRVPADARILQADNLATIEANLTGEAMPVEKEEAILKESVILAERKNLVFFGTVVARGRARAIVCQIGQQTEFGKIAKLIRETTEEKTPLQNQLSVFGHWLTVAVILFSAAIFVFGFVLGKEPLEMFMIAVALAVAAIPEGLLVAVTIILALGMQAILKKKALVRRLVAAETLGSTSIICTDKTGTLTEGKMQVDQIAVLAKQTMISELNESTPLEKTHELILKIGVLCSNASIENPQAKLEKQRLLGDPTEQALLLAAISAGLKPKQLTGEYQRLAEIPFGSATKYMATLNRHHSPNHLHVFVKGAPERVLAFASRVLIGEKKEKLTAKHLNQLKNQYENLTKKGLRVLAFAYKTGENFKPLAQELNNLVFLGFIALKDPLRTQAKEAIALCRQAGIRPILVTGDHHLTARAIYEELGLPAVGKIVEGKELDGWSDQKLQRKIKDIAIYARVEPKHKLRIVQAWQAKGEVVAMTGDGINDAPALKAADIGIALGSGSDVTKETADVVLLDNDFSVIVAAVRQGRIIFENIRKVIAYLLSDSFSEIILIAGSLFLGLPLPIFATQILFINLLADGLPAVALTAEPAEAGLMQEGPRSKNASLLDREMKILIFLVGIITDLILFGLFVYLLKTNGDLTHIRTVIFMALGLNSLFYVFSIRSRRHFIFFAIR